MKIFILPLLFISFTAVAQKKDSAVLQSFKFRTPNFRAVALQGNAAGLFGTVGSGSEAYFFQVNPSLNSTRLISTNNRLYSSSFNVSAIFYAGNNAAVNTNPFQYSQEATTIEATLSHTMQDRKYSGLCYKLLGYSSTVQQFYNKSNASLYNNRSGVFTTAAFNVGKGKGRIENVTDAQMAYNILTELQKNRLLEQEFTIEDAYGLAQTITQINNIRLFDFRRKRIYELKQIDSFLHLKGLIKNNSIDYFTTVADNWFYAFNQLRRHGKEKYITLSPGIGYSISKTSTNGLAGSAAQNAFQSGSVTLTIGIEKAIAKSIKRQFTKGASLQTSYVYIMNQNKSNGVVTDGSGSNVYSFLNGFLQWGYYPSTRTSINTTLNNTFVVNYQNTGFANNTLLSLDGNYFISYNTRVFVNVTGGVTATKTNTADLNGAFISSFNIGLQHFIR